MKKYFVLFFILFTSQLCQAQLESAIWYFGDHAGLDFNSGAPVVINNSIMNTSEGCASISNSNGELLFYTDGDTVYNKNHQVMGNGTGLLGHDSSSQSAIIIKKPGSTHIYYIITVDGATGNQGGLCYSEVDMNLDNGNGGVTNIKNIELLEFAAEKVCVVKHQNNIDFWIVAREESSNNYHSFLLTNQGIQQTAVVSTLGTSYNGTRGYLRASPNGNKIAAAFFSPEFLIPGFSPPFAELYDFDKSTGLLSNPIIFEQDSVGFNRSGYGVEFSPNSNRLYVSTHVQILQYDLTENTSQDIIDSRQTIATPNNPWFSFGSDYMAMQLALDSKIYVAAYLAQHIHVINNPNELGNACDFSFGGIPLPDPARSMIGLPTFINTFLPSAISPSILSQDYCLGDLTSFSIDSSFYEGTTATSFNYNWDFDDPNSGSLNTSTESNPSHIFTNTGNYTVSLTITTNDGQSFTEQQVVNIMRTNINLGPNLNLCQNQSHSFDASTPNATYLWHDGSTHATYSTNDDELVWAEVSVNGCTTRDSVEISYVTPPEAIISLANLSCTKANVQIDITGHYPPYTLTYTNGNENHTIESNQSTTFEITEQGDYTLVNMVDAKGCEGNYSGMASYNHNKNNLDADFDFSPKDAYFDDATITFTNLSDHHTNAFWDFGDGNTYDGLGEIVKNTYHSSGHYLVTLNVKDEFGCDGKVEKIVPILTYGFYLPNAFTPDDLGDVTNNVFGLKTDKLKSFTMLIYDRWGSELYRTSDLKKPWDGKYKNRLLPTGVYTYHLNIITLENRAVTLNGTVTLMR